MVLCAGYISQKASGCMKIRNTLFPFCQRILCLLGFGSLITVKNWNFRTILSLRKSDAKVRALMWVIVRPLVYIFYCALQVSANKSHF